MKKRILALALSMTMIWCSALNVALAAEEVVSDENGTEIIEDDSREDGKEAENGIIASGNCGTDVKWVLEEDGTLTISGSGEMEFEEDTPWKKINESITKVVIEPGVTSIAEMAFQ